MYELIKQKSTGQRIIFGIIIFAFITAVLKMALPTSSNSVNDELIKIASGINKNAPVYIDSVTKLDNVQVLPGKILRYNYSLGYDKTIVDTTILHSEVKKNFIESRKSLDAFKKYDITVQARYIDKNGEYVAMVLISPNEY